MSKDGEPVGVVLAGGLGRRIGGAKAAVELNRRALISYPIEAVWRALGNVTIVAKIDTNLPSLPGITVWVEPQEPRHPLTGIIHALGMAGGRPVMVCAADMPLVTPKLIGAIAHADPRGARAVVASASGELQPLLGCYQPSALEPLAAARGDVALREVVEALGSATYEVAPHSLLYNVNTPDELLRASAMLSRRGTRARAPDPR